MRVCGYERIAIIVKFWRDDDDAYVIVLYMYILCVSLYSTLTSIVAYHLAARQSASVKIFNNNFLTESLGTMCPSFQLLCRAGGLLPPFRN